MSKISRPSNVWMNRCIQATLVLLVVAAYAPSLRNGFVFDDNQYVVNNGHVNTGLSFENFVWAWTNGLPGHESYASNWHPLTWLSLQADAQLFGLDKPWGFHLTNVLLHVANTLLLFALLRRGTGAWWRSAVVAAFFGLHPLHVESVAWVAERKDLLSTLFGFLALWCYFRYAAVAAPGKYLMVLVSFALSLLAKPMLVTLPFVLLLLDYWPLGRWQLMSQPKSSPGRKTRPSLTAVLYTPPGWLLIEKLPFLALSVLSSLATVQAQQSAMQTLEHLPPQHRVANALVSYVAYLGQMCWPVNLTVYYPLAWQGLPEWQPITAAVFLLGVTGLAAVLFRRMPYLIVGWLWYLGTLVPVIGLVQVGIQSRADRYTYVPLIGIFIAVAWAVPELFAGWGFRRRLLLPACGLLLAAWFALLVTQLGYWHDEYSLWSHAAEVTPENAVTHNNAGAPILNQDTLEGGQSLSPAERKKRLSEAERHFMLAVKYDPRYVEAWYNLGLVLEKQDRFREAEQAFAAALKLDPEYPSVGFHLGLIQEQEGRLAEAATTFARLAQRQPQDTDVRLHCGLVLVRLGRFQEALAQWLALVQLTPDQASAHYQLGLTYALLGRFQEAAASYRRAIELQPSIPGYFANLGYALYEQKRTDEAMQAYRKAFELDSAWPESVRANAWNLATHPQAWQRNGALAVMLAKNACYATGASKPEYLDTLAAAYAEVGDFARATAAARQAEKLASQSGSDAPTQQLQERIRLYENKQPYRQS